MAQLARLSELISCGLKASLDWDLVSARDFIEVRSQNGRAVVKVRRYTDDKGRVLDRVWWTDAGGRRHSTNLAVYESDPGRATRHAAAIAEEVANDQTADARLSSRETREFLAARDALAKLKKPPPVDVACREFASAMEKLEQVDTSLPECVFDFMRRNSRESRLFSETVSTLVDRLRKERRSKVYVDQIERWGQAFVEFIGDRPICDIRAEQVDSWIDSEDRSAKTLNNRRGGLISIFRFALDRGWCDSNPAQRRKIPVTTHPTPYSADEVRRILKGDSEKRIAAIDADLIPFVTLQCFGCCRAIEVARLEWKKHVQIEQGVIRLTSDVTKTKQTRIVEIQPNLAEWLRPWKSHKGRIYDNGSAITIYKRLRRAFLRDIKNRFGKSFDVKKNGLRAACASNLVPLVSHIGAAAEMMGHTVAQMKSNYRELVSASEADEYWSIEPESALRIVA